MSTQPGKILFGDICVDRSTRSVSRGGADLKFSTREFDALVFLIENAGTLLSHDEIIACVWSGIAVSNNSVEKIVAKLRKELGDSSSAPVYIKTVHGKGYVFIAEIKSGEISSDARALGPADFKPSKLVRYGFAGVIVLATLLFIGWDADLFFTRLRATRIISDDFSSEPMDTRRWTIRGKTASIDNGILRLRVEETDNGPRLFSRWFAFDRKKPITIRSRLRVAYSRNLKDAVYFTAFFGLQPHTSTELEDEIIDHTMFGVAYTDYDYESRWPDGSIKEVEAEGFFLTRRGGQPHMKIDYQNGNISERIEPVWDKWFDQTIVYDPQSGEMKFFIDEKLRGDFNAGPFITDIGRDELRIEVNPRGWWLYHEIDIDYIDIYQ